VTRRNYQQTETSTIRREGFCTPRSSFSRDQSLAETKRIQHVFSRAKQPGQATLKVELNIYGSVEDAKIIGDILSASKMFLQDPDHGTQDIEYCNPHIVQFPGVEEPMTKVKEHGIPKELSVVPKTAQQERDTFNQTISSIYQSLTRFRDLERIQEGNYVTTPFLP